MLMRGVLNLLFVSFTVAEKKCAARGIISRRQPK
jgi:hypothetical protein